MLLSVGTTSSDGFETSCKTGIPFRIKELRKKDTAEKEQRVVEPISGSPYYIEVPKLIPKVSAQAQLQSFDIIPSYAFSSVTPELVGSG